MSLHLIGRPMHIGLLAMMLAVAPASASVERAKELGPIAQVTPPCTNLNPCAVATPEIGAAETPAAAGQIAGKGAPGRRQDR